MTNQTLRLLLGGCTLAAVMAASAQDPLARSHSLDRSATPIAGQNALLRPAKVRDMAGQHRLGERNPLKPPFVEVFDDYPSGSEYDQFERYFQIINSDGDKNPSGTDRSWGYYNFNGESGGRKFSKCAYLQYPLDVSKCDDWLVPRAIKVEAGKYYHITMDVSLYTEGCIHTLEVKMGEYNDAEGLNIPVIPVTDVVSIIPEQIEGWFVPEFDGIYYMGIHGLSDRSRSDGGYLFVDNIAMEAARSGREPAQVTDLEFVCDPDGTPSATVSFKTPGVGVDGKAITGELTVTVKRDGTVIRTITATPDQAISFVDQVAKAGNYAYTFTVSSAEGTGCDLRVNRYIGMAKPLPPVITSFTEPVEGTAKITWTAPETDINGTVINPEKLRYNLLNVGDLGLEPVKSGFDGLEYTVDMNLSGGQQVIASMVVSAQINDVESDYAQTDFIFVGEPYAVPYENHFSDTGDDFVIGAEAGEGVQWRILDDFSDPKAQDGDSRYVCMIGSQPDQHGELSTGKLNLAVAENPFVSFYTYVYEDDDNIITVMAVDCETGERTVLRSFVLSELDGLGWTRIICPLTGFGGKTIRVVLGVDIVSHGYIPIDNMLVDDLSDVDLSVERVNHERYAAAGDTYFVNAKIANIGAKRVYSYTVRLISDDKVIDTVKADALDSFATAEVILEGSFTAISPEMPTFVVEVQAEGDANPANNFSDEFNIAFLAPCHPVVVDLAGVENDNDVTLSWTAPDLASAAPEESFEDFESYPAFTTAIKGFTMKDQDEGFIAGFTGVDMPVAHTKQAFWTMTADAPFNFLYTRGKSSLFTMATVDEDGRPTPNDDWLISPELYGGRQIIGFEACSQTIDYGYETFEVYASSTTPSISQFRRVMNQTAVGEYFEQFYVTLPAGTKYFAIRCTSDDRLLFTLDNISYIGTGEPRSLSIVGYNVYRNGELLTPAPITATTFKTTRDLAGDDYFVTTVYDKGESTASNIVHFGIEGISDATVETAPAEYFDLRGLRVNPSELTPGIYIRRQGSLVTKEVIR